MSSSNVPFKALDAGHTGSLSRTTTAPPNTLSELDPEIDPLLDGLMRPLSVERGNGNIDIPDFFKKMFKPIVTFTDHTQGGGGTKNAATSANMMKDSAKKGQKWAILGIVRFAVIYFLFPWWTMYGKPFPWFNFTIASCEDQILKPWKIASIFGHDGWMFLTFVVLEAWWYKLAYNAFGFDADNKARFAHFAASVYALVLIQFVFAVLVTCKPEKIMCCELEKLPTTTKAGQTTQLDFKTIYEMSGTNDLAVLMHQADLAGLEAVTDLAKAWELRRLRHMQFWDQNAENFEKWPKEAQIAYLYAYLSLCQRKIAKFALVGLCQNVATANVQTSFIAILAYVLKTKEKMTLGEFMLNMPFAWYNVICCFIGTLLALGDVMALFDLRGRFHTKAININTVQGGHATRLLDRIWRILYRRFPVYLTIYICVTLWTLAKFVAIFACTETHLWNLPSPIHLSEWKDGGCFHPK